ncbi:MAG: YcaO-like family protein [Deltaproteobacteria bacterium]|nr:YcaO-like family protein [Deltaproteobacteria bacterium]
MAELAALGEVDQTRPATLICAAEAAEVGTTALGPHVLPVVGRQPDDAISGADVSVDTPSLMVAAAAMWARLNDGGLGHVDGPDARVAIVAGLAALWIERLRNLGIEPTPTAVRAALLAAARPGPTPWPRRVENMVRPDSTPIVIDETAAGEAVRLSLSAAAAGPRSVAVVARPGPASPLWRTAVPPLEVHVTGASGTSTHAGVGAVVVDLELAPGETIELKIDALPGQQLFVVGLGLTRIRRRIVRSSTRKGPVILGISASHNASACLMRDGQVEYAIQLERITRVKRDGHPFLHSRAAADYCLAAAGLRPRDVDVFAWNAQPLNPRCGLNLPSHDESFDLFDPFGARSVFASHHLCHAFGAFFSSPFERATVLVVDGAGGSTIDAGDIVLRGPELSEYLATPVSERLPSHVVSVYAFDPTQQTLIDREYSGGFKVLTGTDSLGEAYATISQYVFGNWQDGGKLMGLAPYGDPDACGPSLLARNGDGRLTFRTDWKNRYRRALDRGEPLQHRDLAARVQRDLETALIDRTRRAIERTGCSALAYAGGVALNGVANERLRTECGVQRMFVQPSSNDAGVAIGAAAAAHHMLTGSTRGVPPRDDFLGYRYGDHDYRDSISRNSSTVRARPVQLADVVERLAAGQIVGWFDGAAEFGPRALGHRSLLASAQQASTWAYINRRIKFREDFRPFAPMVPEELAHRYFEMDEPSPYMLRVVQVRPEYREVLGAVTHVDGSARVQTVSRDVLPEIHELLLRWGAHSGLPVLLNTSMNVRGEPIVETPDQALELMLCTHLDAVVLGHQWIVEPHREPEGRLTEHSVLRLPPKTEVVVTATARGRRARLVCGARGNATYDLPPWAESVLGHADGQRTVAQLLGSTPRALNPGREQVMELLGAFHALRLVLTCDAGPGPAARAEIRPSAAVEAEEPSREHTTNATSDAQPAEPSRGVTALTTPDDRRPVAPHSERVQSVTSTIRRVWSLRQRLGVTRVADYTSYDRLDIPVYGCTRPAVHESDITATQGKGLTADDALASCLMETVERYSGWHRRHRPRVETTTQIRQQVGSIVSPAELGFVVRPQESLDWVCGTSLRDGHEVWVPASEIFAPYLPPDGVGVTLPCSTTGLSSGNTLAEAVLHGVDEVVERDVLSRYIDGQAGSLLDLTSIPEGPERALVDRFVAAGLEVYVVDMCELGPLPTFSACVYDPAGVEPRIATAGQGTARSPQVALRRALLEAAQSRVVALQGSREDLQRHGSRWVEDDGARQALWEDSRAAAARGGVSRFPSEPAPPSSVEESLQWRLDRLEHDGHSDIIYVDLTHPDIGIPVAGVVIPGMYDGQVGLTQRRRRPR